ncbi:MAG: polysaccharide deacetylase family protein [Myxococcota bacterium]|nr:polysaccharide deacetylase family protein [Myxococcota bacterium]
MPPEESWCSGNRVRDDLDGRRVALTFDDGPFHATTPAVLDALRAEDVPATFFVLGRQLENPRHREILREISADPLFTVANHSYTHRDMVMLDDAELEAEISDTNEAIREALGDPCYFPRYFRFPYGGAECRETRIAETLGMSVVGFDIDPVDWCFDEDGHCDPARVSWLPAEHVATLIGYLLQRLEEEDGGIVLLHDPMPYTAAILPELLVAVRDAGYTFVRLDELPETSAAAMPPEAPMCCGAVDAGPG